MPSVRVPALQGSFNEHISALRRIGLKGVEVRKAEQLESLSGLIIPGGESTLWPSSPITINSPPYVTLLKQGGLVWGTCAGLIFLADRAVGAINEASFSHTVFDCSHGFQIQSLETKLLVLELAAKEGGPTNFLGVFIRAPAILEVGPDVEVLAKYSVVLDKSMSQRSPCESQEAVRKEHLLP